MHKRRASITGVHAKLKAWTAYVIMYRWYPGNKCFMWGCSAVSNQRQAQVLVVVCESPWRRWAAECCECYGLEKEAGTSRKKSFQWWLIVGVVVAWCECMCVCVLERLIPSCSVWVTAAAWTWDEWVRREEMGESAGISQSWGHACVLTDLADYYGCDDCLLLVYWLTTKATFRQDQPYYKQKSLFFASLKNICIYMNNWKSCSMQVRLVVGSVTL